MRELNHSEVEQVAGGGIPLLILGPAAFAGLASYANGNSISTSLGAAVLGGLGGGAGVMARLTTGIVRYKFGAQSTALAFSASTVSDSNAGGSIAGGKIELGEAVEIDVSK